CAGPNRIQPGWCGHRVVLESPRPPCATRDISAAKDRPSCAQPRAGFRATVHAIRTISTEPAGSLDLFGTRKFFVADNRPWEWPGLALISITSPAELQEKL